MSDRLAPSGFLAVLTVGMTALTGCGDEEIIGVCASGCGPSISVTPQSVTLAVGDTTRLAAQAQAPGDVDPEYSWSSEDPGIASVDSLGVATGRSPGETVVRVTATISDTTLDAASQVTVVSDTAGG